MSKQCVMSDVCAHTCAKCEAVTPIWAFCHAAIGHSYGGMTETGGVQLSHTLHKCDISHTPAHICRITAVCKPVV